LPFAIVGNSRIRRFIHARDARSGKNHPVVSTWTGTGAFEFL